MDDGRCAPCEDGRRLLIAAVAARLAWGLATHRLAAEPEGESLRAWAALAASSLAPVLAYRLSLSLRLPRGAALAAGFLLAVQPALVDAGTLPSMEAAVPALVAGALAAWVYAWQSRRAPGAVLGTACALAAFFAGGGAAPAAHNKWLAAMTVTPTPGGGLRGLENAAAAAMIAAAFVGLRRVAAGPGGRLALAWLACAAVLALRRGNTGALLGDPMLAVAAGAGLFLRATD